MYRIDVPDTIHRLIAVFHRLGFFSNGNEPNLCERGKQFFYLVSYLCFMLSVAKGACITTDRDESIYLTVIAIIASVEIYRLGYILLKKNEIIFFVHLAGTHCTDDENEYIQISNQLKLLMKFVQYFMVMIVAAVAFTTIVFPVVNMHEKRLFFNIALPLDYSNSEIGLWMGFALITVGMIETMVGSFFATIPWYLLQGFVFKYKLLGIQIRNLGVSQAKGVSIAERQKAYLDDLNAVIQTYENVNGYVVTGGRRFH